MKHFILSLVLLYTFNLSAQQITCDVETLKDLKNRPVIVILQEIDDDLIEKYENKIERTDNDKRKSRLQNDLDNIEEKISSFNKNLKKAVNLYWKFNDSIIFMYYSEYDDFEENLKNDKYALLTFGWYSTSYRIGSKYSYSPDLPSMYYYPLELNKKNRVENNFRKNSYFIHFPNLDEDDDNHSYSEIAITLNLMQKNFSYNIENDKALGLKYFANNVGENGCKKLSDYTLYVNKELLDDSPSETKAEYEYKMQIVDTKKVESILSLNEDNNAVAFIIPWKLAKMTSDDRVLWHTDYYMIIIDSKTFDIIHVYFDIHDFAHGYRIRKKAVKRMMKCK
jgi:hypothetical protein